MFGRPGQGWRRGGAGATDEVALEPAELRQRAIRLLARREHSRAEMRQKLARSGGAAADVEALLDALESEKLLSDLRFAESVARVRAPRYGSQRVANDLRQRGVGAVAVTLIADLKAGDQARAQAAWERKFGAPPASAGERAKQMRFLQARGFPGDVIRQVVPRTLVADDPQDE